MEYPEPRTIPEYQAELKRVWDVLLGQEMRLRDLVEKTGALRHESDRVHQIAVSILTRLGSVRDVQ